MSAAEVGKKLVSLCQQGKNAEAIEGLYHPDIVSVEAQAMPGGAAETKGRAAVMEKNQSWMATHEIHSSTTEGPYPHGDRFAVRFSFDVTDKPSGKRMQMTDVALYTVKDGKIVREEFFYAT